VKPSDSTYRITVPLAQRAPKLDSLVAGFGGTCGIGHDHDLYCWGDGFTLGSRATEKCFHVDEWSGCSWAPARVALDSIVSVTMGFVHACALAQSGAAFCWGDNAAGALGNGSKRSSVEPRSVDMHLQ
jgi:hypothetical protein